MDIIYVVRHRLEPARTDKTISYHKTVEGAMKKISELTGCPLNKVCELDTNSLLPKTEYYYGIIQVEE